MQDVDALQGEQGGRLVEETLGIGGEAETCLSDALWCCSNLYSDIKLRLSHKRLMLFTCRDQPHGGDATRDRQARTRAGDLKDTGKRLVPVIWQDSVVCSGDRHPTRKVKIQSPIAKYPRASLSKTPSCSHT